MNWLSRFALVVALAGPADARPGGGQTYSSGGGSYSGGHLGVSGGGGYSSSGGGDGSDVLAFAELAMAILFIVILLAILIVNRFDKSRHWNSHAPRALQRGVDLKPLLASDPDFSRAVFEDFAFALYAAAQRAALDPVRLAALAPYLAPSAAAQLSARGNLVEQVVVGALQIDGCDRTLVPPRHRLAVRFESNLALGTATLSTVEHWVFSRATDVRTRPSSPTHSWPCPSCGAPWSRAASDPRTCDHCGEAVHVGRFDWAVEQIWVDSETDVGPTLTGTVAEAGNDFPTIVDRDAHTAFASLAKDDSAVTSEGIRARAAMIYERLTEGWNQRDLAPVRGLATRALQDYLQYWLDQHRRQGLENHLDNAKVRGFDLAKVIRDRYFDAITLRVFADGNDYTLDGTRAVVAGSRTANRPYTEYWTLLRSATRRGPVVTTPSCPSCGAPLAISDAGACTHCNAEIENASFDWVLSKIEQDDVYRG